MAYSRTTRTGFLLILALLAGSSNGLRLSRTSKSKAFVPTDDIMLPKCKEVMHPRDLRNMDWCNPKFAPNNSPPPKFLQGLYWMRWGKHSDLIHDVAVCMSTAHWDNTTMTMKMPKNWDHFVFKADQEGYKLAAMNELTGMHYDFPCEDKGGEV